ncbi:uncharacterized protein LOC108026589 isoform X2 [Drosophila biarmipes]|nr:uncharacterized protein LOC108026589 isoform X2 [Drosophila biarmipes]
MASFGNTLQELVNRLLARPEIKRNPTPEVGWAMLDFLLIMSNETVLDIRRNRVVRNRSRLSMMADIEAAEREREEREAAIGRPPINPAETEVDWTALLSEDFLEPPEDDSSESLSDWSDDSDSDSTCTLRPEENVGTSRSPQDMASVYDQAMQLAMPNKGGSTGYLPPVPDEPGTRSNDFSITQPLPLSLQSYQGSHLRMSRLVQLAPLKPPGIATQYRESDRNTNVLSRTIHAHWWRGDVKVFALPASSTPMANFAVSYVQLLNRNARGLLDLPLPKTTTESCLMREILFMFVRPASCCFFEFDEPARRISVRSNVSICTVTAGTLRGFLQHNVVPALEDMMELRRIIDTHTLHFDGIRTTGTLECFAYGLRDLIQPISQRLIAYEERVVSDPAKNTLVSFIIEFRVHFRQLRLLRHLAEDVILNIGPPHLRSAYLLSRLYNHTRPQVLHQKLATALLLVTLKRYCNIIDGWWRRATLEDRLNEFIVERWVEEDADRRGYVRRRSLHSDESLEVVEKFKQLHACPIYQLLLKHALESGETQDLLANVNLLGEMLATSNESQPPSLHDELAAQVFAQVEVYCGAVPADEGDGQEVGEDPEQVDDKLLVSNVQGIRNLDLFAIFTQPAQRRIAERKRLCQTKKPLQLANILSRLERSTPLQLKAEIPEALREILRKRQCLANEYAMRAYRKELQLGETVRFLRHTMLLESYYLLLPYYTALFSRIENTENWARDSVLSSKLARVLMPHYPELADNLHVRVISKVTCNSTKVYEALEALELVYDMPVAMQGILAEKHMQGYNSVWRLMLKIKWAVWKLENLVFLRPHKGGNPYAPLDLLGLTIRRLEILRFWLIYLINSLHTHIMQAVAQQFEFQIAQCKNIRQLRSLHDGYLSLLRTHCLLTDEFRDFRIALEQLFHLVFVLDMEWTSCACYLGQNDALCLDFTLSDDGIDDGESERRSMEYLALNQVVEIELAYIRCHQTLAEMLNSLVYKHDHGFLTALEVAIGTSVPH